MPKITVNTKKQATKILLNFNIKFCLELGLAKPDKTEPFPEPITGFFGSTRITIDVIRRPIKNQQISKKPIMHLVFGVIYSPWILSSPKPTLNPVRVKAHITPAVVKISLAIIVFFIL